MAFLDEELNENTEQIESPEVEQIVEEESNGQEEVATVNKGSKKKEETKKTSKTKALFSELKKVSWLGFGKVVKQTAVVLAVTAVFLVVIFGIDSLLKFLNDLITSKM